MPRPEYKNISRTTKSEAFQLVGKETTGHATDVHVSINELDEGRIDFVLFLVPTQFALV